MLKTVQYRKSAIKLIIFMALSNIFAPGKTQPDMINSVFKESIKSVQMYREGFKQSYPVSELQGVSLVLSFDELASEVKNYSYKLVHCDSDWNPSSLSESEYIKGSLYNQIYDYSFSFNTFESYIHYELKLPNEEVSFKISGNYALIIFDDFDEDNIVLIKRFMITEKLVNIDARINRPVLSEFRNSHQEIDFNILYGNLNIEDPYQDIRVIILQNGRWDNAIDDLKPLFIRSGGLEYDYQMENLFPGGNEFRWFDIKSMRYQSPYVKDIEFQDNAYYVELFPDDFRSNKVYFYDDDLNGNFYVEIQEETNNETDADYVYVDFSLPMDAPLTDEDIYVAGAMTNWIFTDTNKMEYDFDNKEYFLRLHVKQGYYNYQYALLSKRSDEADTGFVEGNYYETENDYIILVYHYGTTSRYERLIGYTIINTLHQ